MKDKQVTSDTKQAAKEEGRKDLNVLLKRQKLYNEMYEARLAGRKKNR